MYQSRLPTHPVQESTSPAPEATDHRYLPHAKAAKSANAGNAFGPSLKSRALRLLSQREHSRLELVKKLAVHAPTAQELATLLDALEAKDFINPQRVADSVVNRRSARLGAARIRHELLAKGLQADVVAQALEPVKASEIERAQSIWQKKFGTKAGKPGELGGAFQARQMRFLAGRGFSGEVVRQVLQKMQKTSAGEVGYDPE